MSTLRIDIEVVGEGDSLRTLMRSPKFKIAFLYIMSILENDNTLSVLGGYFMEKTMSKSNVKDVKTTADAVKFAQQNGLDVKVKPNGATTISSDLGQFDVRTYDRDLDKNQVKKIRKWLLFLIGSIALLAVLLWLSAPLRMLLLGS